MSPVLLYACLNGDCTVYLFKTKDGKCARCGQDGWPLLWKPKKEDTEPPAS